QFQASRGESRDGWPCDHGFRSGVRFGRHAVGHSGCGLAGNAHIAGADGAALADEAFSARSDSCHCGGADLLRGTGHPRTEENRTVRLFAEPDLCAVAGVVVVVKAHFQFEFCHPWSHSFAVADKSIMKPKSTSLQTAALGGLLLSMNTFSLKADEGMWLY